MNKRALLFLQNAWSPLYAGGTWPRESWLKALKRSRSGQRLGVLQSHCPVEMLFYNTTLIVGSTADSIVPADPEHIRKIIATIDHDVVVTLGKLAALAVTPLAKTPVLQIPHPAHRVLTSDLYLRAAEIISEGFAGVVTLKQERGIYVERRSLTR